MKQTTTLFKLRQLFGKTLPLLVFLAFSLSTVKAQFVNGNLGTGTVSKSGVVAPAGTQWHEMQGINNNSTERRVGVKYRITLRTPDCDIREVDSSYTFHSGDKVRLQVESNVDGYLYVLQKGSTGKDKVLFPDAKINAGDNKIARGILYSIPANQWYAFDNNPGTATNAASGSRSR